MAGKGQPKKQLNYEIMDELLQFKCSKPYIAKRLGISIKTIDNRIREDHDMTFTEYADHVFEGVKLSLKREALKMAIDEHHPTMMIFALKNYCGWTDKVEQKVETGELKIVIDQHDANF